MAFLISVRNSLTSLAVLVAFGFGTVSATEPVAATPSLDFDRDIRPILQRRCMECHGPDEQSGGLRFDLLASLKAGGDSGPAIDLSEPASSLILKAVRGDEDVSSMPPEGDPLTAEQIEKIANWIQQGAPGDESTNPARLAAEHWSFQPIRNPIPPTPRQANWIRNPIDAFILDRLESEGIAPSPEAERLTLLRRVSLDLTGLPPKPEELEAFLLDNRPDAYELAVERLLASPHYGERWGRYWLDQARYADSHGYTIDGPRDIWKYRDWVIDALNRNLPFDQFVIEQLAGDLLPDATLSQRVATGFHRNTMINQEGGTDKEQFRVEAVNDRIGTTGEVLMGLTTACAQCHSHKFDPISHREYYQLFAFFNNSDEPSIPVPTPEETAATLKLSEEIALIKKELKRRDRELDDSFISWEQEMQSHQQRWQVLVPTGVTSSGGAQATIQADHSVRFSGTNAASDTYTVVATLEMPAIGALRLEVLTDESLPSNGPGRAGNGNFILSELTAEVAPFGSPEARTPLKLESAHAEHSQPKFPIEHVVDGDPKTGWAINTNDKRHMNRDRVATFQVTGDNAPGKKTLILKVHHLSGTTYNIGRLRFAVTPSSDRLPMVPAEIASILTIPSETRSAEQAKQLREHFLSQDGRRRELLAQIDRLEKEKPKPVTTMVVAERREPRPTFIHLRGDFLRQGDRVNPGVPAILPPLPAEEKPDRLTFARWLFLPEHPLTARVAVNRVWMRYFGLGIVETDNDFGTMGIPPSHPELLDWLAYWFREQGWDQKGLHRLIVTSATYRQSSLARPELETIDPRNRLLARQSRLRVDAEIVRDIALSVSGRLSPKVGGPSVFPYQADGVMALAQVAREWKVSEGEDRYRRGMYTFFWRSTPHPFLKVFDAPDAQRCATNRTRSNTPLQSLMLLNDLSMLDCAEGLADRVLHSSASTDRDRVRAAYLLCLCRPPTAAEMEIALAFLESFRESPPDSETVEETVEVAAGSGEETLSGNGSEAPIPAESQAAQATRQRWVAFARAMLNLDELITRE